MSINMKYYRKLRRTDPDKAKRYLDKLGITGEPVVGTVGRPRVRPIKYTKAEPAPEREVMLEEKNLEWLDRVFPYRPYHIWSDRKETYVLSKYRDPIPGDEQALKEAKLYAGAIVDEPMDCGNLSTQYFYCGIKQGDYYITQEYWVELTEFINKLCKQKDVRGLWMLEKTIPLTIKEFRRADLSKLVDRLFTSESDFEADNL